MGIKAVTIKLPHKLATGGTIVIEHLMAKLAVKPKKIGVTVYAATLCGWQGPIKESEFEVHYDGATTTIDPAVIRCGPCREALVALAEDEEETKE